MSRLLLFFWGVWLVGAAHAQADTTRLPYPYPGFRHDEITLHTAYHQGRYGFAELGVGRNVYGAMHHPFGMSYYAGVEARVDRPELWGVKVGGYFTGGSAMGVQYIHYMEGSRSMEVLRPEIGIGVFKARITYAYNCRLSKPHLDGLSTHMVSLAYAFRVARLKGDDRRRTQH